MHRLYGKTDGKQCKDCDHLICQIANKRWYKCSVYGETNSEASDWRLYYTACGLYNKETSHRDVIRLVISDRKTENETFPLDGQINLFGGENNE